MYYTISKKYIILTLQIKKISKRGYRKEDIKKGDIKKGDIEKVEFK